MAIDRRALAATASAENVPAVSKLRGTIELGETARFGDRLITVRRGRGKRIKITIETILTPGAIDKLPQSCN